MVRPQPVMSINCLGCCGVLIGQKRLAMPPAIKTKCFAISLFVCDVEETCCLASYVSIFIVDEYVKQK